jgi:chromosomal replication initiation ATPase DnaA
MGRIQDKWDQAEEARQVRQKNEVCSSRLLEKLIRHHGQVEEEDEPEEAAPEPVQEPANFPALHKVEVIKRAVCKQFNIPRTAIESATRKANVVRPRQIAMYLVRKHTNHSYAEIGRRLGGRDHSTILHAFHKINSLIGNDASLAAAVSELEAAIS